jgi:hypothetical protein
MSHDMHLVHINPNQEENDKNIIVIEPKMNDNLVFFEEEIPPS